MQVCRLGCANCFGHPKREPGGKLSIRIFFKVYIIYIMRQKNIQLICIVFIFKRPFRSNGLALVLSGAWPGFAFDTCRSLRAWCAVSPPGYIVDSVLSCPTCSFKYSPLPTTSTILLAARLIDLNPVEPLGSFFFRGGSGTAFFVLQIWLQILLHGPRWAKCRFPLLRGL